MLLLGLFWGAFNLVHAAHGHTHAAAHFTEFFNGRFIFGCFCSFTGVAWDCPSKPDSPRLAMMAKRSPWETRSSVVGLQIPHPEELSLASGLDSSFLKQIPSDQIYEHAVGFSLATIHTVSSYAQLRSAGPLALITRGYVRSKIESMGVDSSRIGQVTLTTFDPLLNAEEQRAVTIVNMALDPDSYIFRQEDSEEVKLDVEDKLSLMAEIRKPDADEGDWHVYHVPAAFSLYVHNLLESLELLNKSIIHKVSVKDDYVCCRLQIPFAGRDIVYAKSGAACIQFRQLRLPRDPMEPQVEVLKLGQKVSLSSAYKMGQNLSGFLGVFTSSQATFVRARDDSIAPIRKVFYKGSSRFNEHNVGIKLIYYFKLMGFPTGTSVVDAVSIMQGLGWTIVLIRAIHLQELSVIIVASDLLPPKTRWSSSMGTVQAVPIDPKERSHNNVKVNMGHTSYSRTSSDFRAIGDTTATTSTSAMPKPVDPQTRASFASTVRAPPSAPSTSLTARVDMLEREMATIKSDQGRMKIQLDTMSSQQTAGFRDLMTAIAELKEQSLASSRSTPITSPQHKHRRAENLL